MLPKSSRSCPQEIDFDGFELISSPGPTIFSRFQPPNSLGLLHELLHLECDVDCRSAASPVWAARPKGVADRPIGLTILASDGRRAYRNIGNRLVSGDAPISRQGGEEVGSLIQDLGRSGIG